MSTPANCPACGAPVRFRYSSAIQTVCEYCRSVLVRQDVNLEQIGKAADVPLDASPVQIGTAGTYGGKAFEVVGRIVYQYELGGWNEWHLAFSDGRSGWLSDAQLEYAVTFLASGVANLPPQGAVIAGSTIEIGGTSYLASVLTLARYKTVEGDLPFRYHDKQAVWFLDLRTPGAEFATIDYSEDPPLLFTGESVEFDDLRLTNLREFEGWAR